MSKVKRKLTFTEVKFDEEGNLLPAKRPRHHPSVKKESNCDVRSATSTNVGPFRALQTVVWTPIAPKRFAETPETCFKNDQSATENTSSATPASLTPNKFDWVQRVEAFVGSEAPEMQVSYWDYSDGKHCCVSEKDLSRFDKSLISTIHVSPILIHVSANGDYVVKVLFRDVLKGTLKHDRDLVYLFRVSTENVICPGLTMVATKEHSSLKRSWGFPFDRIDSKNCFMLHKPQNRKQMPGSDQYNVCRSCEKLHHELKGMSKKREQNAAGRISKSSKCNWRFLSPKSQKRRWRAVTSGVRRLQREIKRLNKQLQVPLSPQFSNQMREITGTIASKFQEDLHDIFEEAETQGKGKIIRSIWMRDVKDRQAFWKDQNVNSKSSYFLFVFINYSYFQVIKRDSLKELSHYFIRLDG